jgi:hypothetical protein
MNNNEPVAWITMNGLSYQQTGLNDRPLYTHPHSDKSVKAKTPMLVLDGNRVYPTAKTLTDEEIHKIAQENFHAGLGINPLDFARAILRKAQENG